MEDDGEAQRFARSRRDRNAIFEDAVDTAPDQCRSLRRTAPEARQAFGQERATAHVFHEHLLAKRKFDGARLARTAPPALGAGLVALRADKAPLGPRRHLGFRLAVEPLADQHGPWENRYLDRRRSRIVERYVNY